MDQNQTLPELIQHIQAGVVVHGPDTKIRMSNPKAQELLGLTESQLWDRDADDRCWRFLREDASPMPVEEFPVNQVLDTGQPLMNFTMGIIPPEAEAPTWVLVSAVPEHDHNQRLSQIIVTFMDITQQKKTENALLLSEARYRSHFMQFPVPIFVWKYKNGRFALSDYNSASDRQDVDHTGDFCRRSLQ